METEILYYRLINSTILFFLTAYLVYGLIKIKRGSAVLQTRNQYAGFWLRIFSALVDGVVLLLIFFGFLYFFDPLIAETPQFVETFIELFIVWIYYAGMHASKYQATIGKMLLGIKVVNKDGEKITFFQSSERFLASVISQLFLYLGYLMIAFTKCKQGFHDKTTETFVIKKPV